MTGSERANPMSPYDQGHALDDLPAMKHAAALFLNSQMVESEEYCKQVDPRREHLYITAAYSLIQCLKAVMSYEDKDLQEALGHLKHGNAVAASHRAPISLSSRLTGFVWSSSRVEALRAMTETQRHAELLYAETLFAKVIFYFRLFTVLYIDLCYGTGLISNDLLRKLVWLHEGSVELSAMINIYMQLGKYVDVMDAEASSRGEGPEDKSIDINFRSGVQLGVGSSNLMLSLMPDKVISLAELFGYQGDRQVGLQLLMKAGGWSKASKEPTISVEQEGLRRSLADIALLVFHLVISSVVFKGVDLSMAHTILEWNLQRYPSGVFFLFGEGRLRLTRSQPALAIKSYEKAMAVQSQYRNLHFISFWEIAISNFALWDIAASLVYWRKLEVEATWSRACYAYGLAVCLLQLGGEEKAEEAALYLRKIPSLVHKIAGKSIPIEKFVARKARKFQSQGGKLLLPALEFSYMFLAIQHAPREVIMSKMLPEVDAALANLKPFEDMPQSYEGGQPFWDDLCLAHFLEGVCLRYVAYPDAEAVIDPTETINLSRPVASVRALRAFKRILEHGQKIKLDHYILYHAHYELGRLYGCMGNEVKARKHLDLILSGKSLEQTPNARKGKYSMQSALILRATAALEALSR